MARRVLDISLPVIFVDYPFRVDNKTNSLQIFEAMGFGLKTSVID
jgi:hypothetical protein